MQGDGPAARRPQHRTARAVHGVRALRTYEATAPRAIAGARRSRGEGARRRDAHRWHCVSIPRASSSVSAVRTTTNLTFTQLTRHKHSSSRAMGLNARIPLPRGHAGAVPLPCVSCALFPLCSQPRRPRWKPSSNTPARTLTVEALGIFLVLAFPVIRGKDTWAHHAAGECKGLRFSRQGAKLGLGARVNGRYRLRRASLARV